MNRLLIVAILPLLLVACDRTRDARDYDRTKDADNTERNVRDRDMKTLTPMDQGENATDRKITQDIRRAIMDDSALSANADNVKIITINGRVTLRGVVNSTQEREAVQSKAQAVSKNVVNELEVKNATTTK